MVIYSFSPFGYEGALVTIEVDLRRGIPATDIVGLADSAVKESRERMQSAIRNSGYEYPSERILISLSPADLKKEGAGFDLPIALAVLSAKKNFNTSVLVMGELELSGCVRPVKGIYAALSTASAAGIRYAIIPKNSEKSCPKGVKPIYVDNLNEAFDALSDIEKDVANGGWIKPQKDESKEFKVEFEDYEGMNLDNVKYLNDLKFAMAVAVAGKHHLLAYGRPGCGKTTVLQCMPQITPKLSEDEKLSVTRVWSLAGLMRPDEQFKTIRPFRMPHQTASIEGICGGGASCRPGEISLAHNGVLFLDEAAEFRSSVLQMLRVPLENHTITLSRAGRSTTFPANFQLIMATNPCPCGNYGSKERICLCSAKSIEQYWKKFSAPLLDRVAIRFDCNQEDKSSEYSVEDLRRMISRAYERQYHRQGVTGNQNLSPEEILNYCQITESGRKWLDKQTLKFDFSPRNIANILKVARTLSDMTSEEDEAVIGELYLKMAVDLHKHAPSI